MLFHAANQNQVKPEISVLTASPFRLITDFLGLIFRAICRISGSTGSSTNDIILACLSVYHSISPFFLFFTFYFVLGYSQLTIRWHLQTVLRPFQEDGEGSQPQVHLHPSSPKPPPGLSLPRPCPVNLPFTGEISVIHWAALSCSNIIVKNTFIFPRGEDLKVAAFIFYCSLST